MRSRSALCLVVALLCAACNGTDDSAASVEPTASASVSTDVAGSTSTTGVTTTTVPVLDAETLAEELSTIEEGLRATGVSEDELAAYGRRQQLAYRAVNRHPEWHSQLQRLVRPVAAGPLDFHLMARAAQTAHAAGRPPSEPATELPAWTIVEPLPIDELLGYYREAEAATGVPWQYLAAIHFQETRMGRVVGVSTAGAVGPMQFLPSTWAACCEGDPTVARDAIIGAARYLVLRGAPADMQSALYGYNPNDGYVGAVTAYAAAMLADEHAYLGFHGWQVFYGTAEGTVRLPVGYSQAAPTKASAYVREHPEDLLPAV
ncbi:MAG: lytic transglycosylase domain-containing protein [Ilumatobacteraceae bacterium]